MTKRPLSTISFNTAPFLDVVLSRLVEDGSLQSYYYIFHNAEKDTTKPHFHLLVIPSRPIDPCKIRKLFVEPDPQLSLPFGCLPFNVSKLVDWLLYAIHYPPYLLRKGLLREYTYEITDIKSNEPFYCIEQQYRDACEEYTDSRIDLFLEQMRNGHSFGSILASGLVPPSQIVFYEKLYRLNTAICGIKQNTVDQTPF